MLTEQENYSGRSQGWIVSDPLLTRAEEEVAECLADGKTCVGTAEWLGSSKKTIYNQIVSIAAKLNASGLNPNEMKPYQLVARWAWLRRERRKRTA